MSRQLHALSLSPFVRQRLATFVAKEHAGDLEQLTDLIETGRLTPTIDGSYSLEQAPEAMARLERGNVRGKVAITI